MGRLGFTFQIGRIVTGVLQIRRFSIFKEKKIEKSGYRVICLWLGGPPWGTTRRPSEGKTKFRGVCRKMSRQLEKLFEMTL